MGVEGGGWRTECCHGNKGFQWWVSMVIVAKFWEVLNGLFKIHNNCAAAEDVMRGREEWVVCTFLETCLVWCRGRRWGGLRTDVLPLWCYLAVIRDCYPSNTECAHTSRSHLYLHRSPPPQGDTWDSFRQTPAPTTAWNRNTELWAALRIPKGWPLWEA